jgi:hypothetical protein
LKVSVDVAPVGAESAVLMMVNAAVFGSIQHVAPALGFEPVLQVFDPLLKNEGSVSSFASESTVYENNADELALKS